MTTRMHHNTRIRKTMQHNAHLLHCNGTTLVSQFVCKHYGGSTAKEEDGEEISQRGKGSHKVGRKGCVVRVHQ